MAWAYAPGMRVVCIDDAGIGPDAQWKPRKGMVYTIATVCRQLGHLAVQLEESLSAPRPHTYKARRFRPLDEHRLDSLRYHLDHPPLHAFDVANDADDAVLARPVVRSPSASVDQRQLREAGL